MSSHETNPTKPARYSYNDEQSWRLIAYQWSRGFDTKDWNLIKSISAPKVRNFESGVDPDFPNEVLTPDEYVAFWSAPTRLGDDRLHTQHFLGGVEFTVHGEDSATGSWQVTATHHRSLADGQQAKWVANGYNKIFYERIDGQWKYGGDEPSLLTYVGEADYVLGDFPRTAPALLGGWKRIPQPVKPENGTGSTTNKTSTKRRRVT